MSIDESKQLLSQYQKLLNSLNGDYKLSQVQISELSHSISTALDTMRKYEKIEQIISDYEEYKWETIEVSDIRRILDGNVD